ncbi:hypothetical protein DYB34_013538 [Aphanomyces astaci]|uniref:Retrovirus-related Pol polyprotein from transposon TNT 1-94-like beta-barrel domain-containing protein n=1 Tax=Aphanomyces astaci TaxID=112090 RepID=A0A3R7DCF1_APHAT|nr:hypothetical protein DYB34_013538 [Aphanomyces astaci]
MADKYLSDSTSRLKPDSSNYREWCVKTRAKINQQKLGKYLNKVNLVTLQLQMSKLEWSERTGLEAFADEFLEFMRKLSAAGDTAADKAHLNHFLGRGDRSGWGRHDDGNNYVKVTTTKTQEISITQAGGIVKTYRHETDEDKSGGPKELEDEIDEVTADLANYATTLSDDEDERPLTQNRCDCGQRRNVPGDEIIRHDAIACKRGVRLADGHPISVTTVGDVRMKSKDTGRTVVFCNVLLVPNLTKTLISISRITDSADAASILFKQDY